MGALSAITGWGLSDLSRRPGPKITDLAKDACSAALSDAGVEHADIDGLILGQSDILEKSELTIAFQHSLGLGSLNLLTITEGKGTTVLQMIQHATLAVQASMAKTVLCVFADTPIMDKRKAGQNFARPSKIMNIPDWEIGYGCYGAIGSYALAASAYKARDGLGNDAFAGYVETCRQWAAMNSDAFLRDPINIEDYLSSMQIVEPLRLLDCAYPVNGAAAFIVTRIEQSEAINHSPVYVHGLGQGHNRRSALTALINNESTGAGAASHNALSQARLSASDIDCLQIYDAFSFSGQFGLEEFGFVPRGAAYEFVSAGEIGPGGKLPTNTGGGQLSSYYLQGATPLVEGLQQAAGRAGTRQVQKNDTVFVTNSGGCLEFHATLVLSPHRTLS